MQTQHSQAKLARQRWRAAAAQGCTTQTHCLLSPHSCRQLQPRVLLPRLDVKVKEVCGQRSAAARAALERGYHHQACRKQVVPTRAATPTIPAGPSASHRSLPHDQPDWAGARKPGCPASARTALPHPSLPCGNTTPRTCVQRCLHHAADPDQPLPVAGLREVAVHPVDDVQAAVRAAEGRAHTAGAAGSAWQRAGASILPLLAASRGSSPCRQGHRINCRMPAHSTPQHTQTRARLHEQRSTAASVTHPSSAT